MMAEVIDTLVEATLFVMVAFALASVLGILCGPWLWHRGEPYGRQLGRDLRYIWRGR